MKKILVILVLAALLSGCIHKHYYPVQTEDGEIVYQEGPAPDDTDDSSDEDAYIGPGLSSGTRFIYTNEVRYPWWSVDYFYLSYGWGRPGASLGWDHGYPYYGYRPYYSLYRPWHRPYDGWAWAGSYYDPLYHGAYFYGAWDPYWHRYYRGYRHGYRDHRTGPGHATYPAPGNSGEQPAAPAVREDQRMVLRPGDRGPVGVRGQSQPTVDPASGRGVARNVTAPSPSSGSNRGMVIRSRQETKPGRERLQPVRVGEVVPGWGTQPVRRKSKPSNTRSVATIPPAPVVSAPVSPVVRPSQSTQPTYSLARPAQPSALGSQATRAKPVFKSAQPRLHNTARIGYPSPASKAVKRSSVATPKTDRVTSTRED